MFQDKGKKAMALLSDEQQVKYLSQRLGIEDETYNISRRVALATEPTKYLKERSVALTKLTTDTEETSIKARYDAAKKAYGDIELGDEKKKLPGHKVEQYAMMESELLSKIYKDVIDSQYPLDSNVISNLQAQGRGYDPLGTKTGLLKPRRKAPAKKRAKKSE